MSILIQQSLYYAVNQRVEDARMQSAMLRQVVLWAVLHLKVCNTVLCDCFFRRILFCHSCEARIYFAICCGCCGEAVESISRFLHRCIDLVGVKLNDNTEESIWHVIADLWQRDGKIISYFKNSTSIVESTAPPQQAHKRAQSFRTPCTKVSQHCSALLSTASALAPPLMALRKPGL